MKCVLFVYQVLYQSLVVQCLLSGTLPDIVAEGVIMGLYAPVDEILPR